MQEIKMNIASLSRLLDRQINDALKKDAITSQEIMTIFETSRMIVRLMTCLWRLNNGEVTEDYITASVSIPQDRLECPHKEQRINPNPNNL